MSQINKVSQNRREFNLTIYFIQIRENVKMNSQR